MIGTIQLNFAPGIGFKGAWRGQIESVPVASGWRGRGLGAQMNDRAVERCRARGCAMV